MRANVLQGFLGTFALSVVYVALAWQHVARNALLVWAAMSCVSAVAMMTTMATARAGQRTDSNGLHVRARVVHAVEGLVWGSLFFLTTDATLASEPPLIELCVVFALSAGTASGSGFPVLGRDLMLSAWILAIVGTAINGQFVVAFGCAAFIVLTFRNQQLDARQFDELRELRHRATDAAEVATELAETDALTGLPNRIALDRVVSELGDGADSPLLAAFVDLDGFKAVNDSHGHQVGDEVLRNVARRLRSVVRSDDFAGRLGGDEFFLLLRDTDGNRWPHGIEGEVDAALSEPMIINGHVIALTASVGTHATTTHSFELDEAHAIADQRMYENKRARQSKRFAG